MTTSYPKPLLRLIRELTRLPTVGQKTAQRLAFHLVRRRDQLAADLALAITDAVDQLRECAVCFNLTDEQECVICRNPARRNGQLLVVEDARDLLNFEAGGAYRGRYHVLGGIISPLDGIGPEQLHLRELLARVAAEQIREVIIGTNPTIEGEATGTYLARQLHPLGVKVTRIGFGVPVGGDLEFADELTIARALESRREL